MKKYIVQKDILENSIEAATEYRTCSNEVYTSYINSGSDWIPQKYMSTYTGDPIAEHRMKMRNCFNQEIAEELENL